MSKVQFEYAQEIQQIAEEIIHQHRPQLAPLSIGYVFRWRENIHGIGRASQKSNATCRVCSPRERFWSGHDAVIEIEKAWWNAASDQERRALVHHELCHLAVEDDADGRSRAVKVDHDLEEFAEVIALYGLWNTNIANFAEQAGLQLRLPIEERIATQP